MGGGSVSSQPTFSYCTQRVRSSAEIASKQAMEGLVLATHDHDVGDARLRYA
ncbi:hypothetical protein BN381_70035 [Candidatus Microthrix parvicella RN1]|uniref:Uncharacterized protein n=1 Tax=Candidatus Neomicrothrix parvicella RN1 TaxID=1229780 RepID=R4Z6I5_9ACTN|nr:hypothetical protein BN381_70035 [Candidatus Microthrix parvicella RN1]